MNWILEKSNKLDFHTNLAKILEPLKINFKNYKWVFNDIDFMSDDILPINLDDDYFILNDLELNKILDVHTQFIWGIISAVPLDEEVILLSNDLPFIEGNDSIWNNNIFQIINSEIEIIAFDSSYTIVKFKNKLLSDKFKMFFEEAIELEKFS
ncbi:MAG TPA: hypothetical protein DCR77_11065 [Flavobacteriaceae bacterium]|jgi:hypothetical protein|uniref:hypothetical protein n=1 Tax=unclassified Empedobacter TaxID=2643773 RepID=UPI000E873708|nr:MULTISPECIES: hypothetical protein [unclassified Empedobacter]MDH0673449.1 hypothetical protein [Empedobacter sp. GD03861]MDH1883327.1 hypothetical protein [Empedobacter sp. GD03797]HAR73931.1 hypothetical protein [Flavobacteriaceae bacterium]